MFNCIWYDGDTGMCVQTTTPQHADGGTMAPDELEHTIRTLAATSSDTEDLLTLYIPPDRTVAEVRGYLEKEHGRRSTGKGTDRGNTGVPAIARAIILLKAFERIPENGLAVFCGHGESGPAAGIAIEPPEHLTDFLLRISTRFDVEPLARMRTGRDLYGLILIDLNRASWGLLRGDQVETLGGITSNVPAKHHKGGQSAARFQRLRTIAAHEFYQRVGEHAGADLLAGSGQGRRLAGVLIGGQNPAATALADGEMLPWEIREKITGTVDMAGISREGLHELARRGEGIIRDRQSGEEHLLLDTFFRELAKASGLAASGEAAVRAHLAGGRVRTLLLSSSLRSPRAAITCQVCGHTDERTIRLGPGETVADILTHTCRVCEAPLIEDPEVDLTEELGRLAISSGAATVILPADTDDGRAFLERSGGIGALLRFRQGE